jgi:adenosine deaminase
VEAVIAAILKGLKEAEGAFGLTCRLIVAALRNHAPDTNARLAEAAASFLDEGVVGFDLAGDEAGYPAQLHAEAFRIADKRGLGITVHAGEAAGPENVRYAVEQLGATRIGHGVRSAASPETLALLRQRGVLLEICPTSNIHTQAVTSLATHPVRAFYDQEIKLSIGDDDPVTSRTRVSNELTLLRRRFGFTIPELRHTQQMGLEAAFLREGALRAELARELE